MMELERVDGYGTWQVLDERVDTAVGRWRMVCVMPAGPLAELLEAVWTSEGEDCFQQEAILPRSRTEVLFSLGGRHWLRDQDDPSGDRAFDKAFVSGLQLRPLDVASPPTTAMAGVRLRPPGVSTFLRDTPRLIAGDVVDLDLILGPQVEDLREQLASEPSLRRRTLILAAAVARRLAPAPPLSDAVRFVLSMLHASGGSASVRELVRATGYSHRWVTERFRAEIGLAPKSYARVVRFETSFERLCALDRVHWAEFAIDSGYYDQSHMVREYRELAGTTPTEVFRRRAPDGLGLLDDEMASRLA